ncbi:hypothetical protein PANT111_520048 [Pantoea brenneri]|uniref:Uncharacterized protein n=1 Tax=Pantoea brenneri TaxID=472694 RepID=A0AAX3JBV7_9GAMM|nr:hypothetical protein PANT111_520048 [Pantoea brenneri]
MRCSFTDGNNASWRLSHFREESGRKIIMTRQIAHLTICLVSRSSFLAFYTLYHLDRKNVVSAG